MNFGDCVLNFFFHVFTCGDHGDPLVLSFRSNYRSFVVPMVPTIHISSSWVVFTLQSIFYVPFWPISAYSKFGHEHIAQIYSVHVLNSRTHIFIYMSSLNPSVDSNGRACFLLYVHAFTWL